ncbi:MAG: hypothetical protein O2958_07565 [Gemmatimonadetes bacterium]|nr:hypothetical protein [Gemmatimonadota bacterium]
MVAILMSQLRRVVSILGFAALLLPIGAQAQLREIITKNVSASSSGGTLVLEFADQERLEIQFDRGSVYVDGDLVGSYMVGDDLDVAWRAILSDAMMLENGALAEMLADWTVPAALAAELADAAQEIDRALEAALDDIEIEFSVDDGSVSLSIGDESTVARLVLRSLSRLGFLQDALAGLGDDFRVHVDEDVVIAEGSVFEGTLVVVEGSLRIEGRVEGDVVVVGGSLDIREGGVITGEARIADSRVVRNSGEVGGGVVDLLENDRDFEREVRDRVRDEVRDEVRRDLRNEIWNVTRIDDSFSIMSPFRRVIRGVGGVLEKLLAIFVLGLIGAGFLVFAGDNVDAISETARRAPGRAAAVGFAGTFLLIPVWILGAVALVVSIIGIPVAIAWIPLFPLAAILASVLGYVAVARNTGEWLADSSFPWTGWIRKSNPVFTLFGGLLGLSLAFIAANVISIAPFLGVLSGLLVVVGVIVTFVAMQIGFGAVLLTRAGRKPEYRRYDPDAAWEAAMNVDVDEDIDTSESASNGGVEDDA